MKLNKIEKVETINIDVVDPLMTDDVFKCVIGFASSNLSKLYFVVRLIFKLVK